MFFLKHAHLKGKAPVLLAIAERAIKNVPESGLLWAAYFRAAVRQLPLVNIVSRKSLM